MRIGTRRARGFTIIELLISLGLAGILMAGAFQISSVFNSQSARQRQIGEMQQSLRTSMSTIERTIRTSGAGMSNGRMQLSPGCSGVRNLFRVQMYNGLTSWPPPVTAGSYDTTAGDYNLYPDVLRVITAVDTGNALAVADTGTVATIATPAAINTSWAVSDYLLFMNTTAALPLGSYGVLRQISTMVPSSMLANGVYSTQVTHSSSGSVDCANNDPSPMTTITYPTPVRRFRNQVYFKILQTAASGNTVDSTRLVVAIVPMSPIDPPTTMNWSILSDDIEDLQLAYLMADGRVCNDTDDPALAPPNGAGVCDPSQATAIRVTLTARQIISGLNKSAAATMKGGYEDNFPPQFATDGRVRRSLTSEITLRN
ncbi:MAG: prepilin-type N-terminal cleavage/methylation domain-containing protein [Polyangia bacterium]